MPHSLRQSVPNPSVRARRRLAARVARLGTAGVVLLALAAGVLHRFWPDSQLGHKAVFTAGTVIFITSYLGLALDRIPGLAIDRAGISLVGATLMVACGALPLEDAYKAIDLDTIILLLGMMIIVANLQLSGFFALAGAWVMRRAHRPLTLLVAVTLVAGFFSAFLVNDAICLVLAPLVLNLTKTLRRNPVPYLLAVAMASNIGSTATITGNPQNMIIGTISRIPYANFTAALAPIALVGLVLTVILIALFYRQEFTGGSRLIAKFPTVRIHRVLLWRSLSTSVILAILFFAGLPPASAAIVIGGLLLLTWRVRSERIYAHIDWSLLLMFAGLFIIVAGAEHLLSAGHFIAAVGRLHLDQVPVLSAVTAVLSNLVSNVPAVLVLKPFVKTLHDPTRAWLTVAMASTLAGNLTMIGSIANLIVVRRAAAGGVVIGFWDYCKVGTLLALLTLLIGTLWLWH